MVGDEQRRPLGRWGLGDTEKRDAQRRAWRGACERRIA
jgi:hypothetical protein